MPKLPDKSQLGASGFHSGRAVIEAKQVNAGAIGAGVAAQGHAMLAGARQLEEMSKEDDGLDVLKAEAQAKTGRLELERGFDTDPDYKSFGQRFDEGDTKIRNEAASLIRNPALRKKWLLKDQVEGAHAKNRVLDRGTSLDREHRVIALNDVMEQHERRYAAARNDDERAAALSDIDIAATAAERTGNVPPHVADRLRRERRDRAIANDIEARLDDPTQINGVLKGLRMGRSGGQLSDQGIERIKRFEGFTKTPKPDGRQMSVGYGTRASGPNDIVRDEADGTRRLLSETAPVSEYIARNVTVPLSQDQHDALTSFGYNLGTDDIEKLLPDINAGNFEKVAQRMLSFNKFEGKESEGLKRRRQEEAALFRGGTPRTAPSAGAGKEAVDIAQLPSPMSSTAHPLYGQLSPDTHATALRRAEAKLDQYANGFAREIGEATKLAEQGYVPRAEDMERLRANAQAIESHPRASELRASMMALDGSIAWQQEARKATPEALERFILAERAKVREGGATPGQAHQIELAEKLATNMRSELKEDALGWADRVGKVRVEPLDFTDGETITATLQARVKQAEAVAAHYGQTPQYLRPDEKRQLIAAMEQGGDEALRVATGVYQATGLKAQVVLTEIFKDAPEMAMLGGLVAGTGGASGVAKDAADGLKLKKMEGFAPMSSYSKLGDMRPTMLGIIGNALKDMPKSETAAFTLANAIYEIRARRNGVSSFDGDLWAQGFREVLGERTVNGTTYGGIVDQNDWFDGRGSNKIILPPTVKQSTWHQVIDAISPDDLKAAGLGAPVGESGKELPMARIRAATLVQVGAGRYAVALGDPNTAGGEKWVSKDRPGVKFEIDLNRLAPIIGKRRPDLFGRTHAHHGGGR